MNKLSTEKRSRVVAALVEGNSINSTVRMTGISKPTILKLIVELGEACEAFHDKAVMGLKSSRVQCDELWAFCGCKARNVKPELKGMFGRGDVWTFTGICADTKMMIGWYIGPRDTYSANFFMRDIAKRLANRVQLTTDGHHTYLGAVGNSFGPDGVDYAQINKTYETTQVAPGRYSPPICTGVTVKECLGAPDRKHVSTSFVERSNLTVRMGIRRYTRLTNGFSKKVENHALMTGIFFTFYNFCRIHKTLRITPAMEAGLSDHVWEIAELVGLLA